MSNERKVKSPEEREAALKEALARIRPQILETPRKEPVSKRVVKFANRNIEAPVDTIHKSPQKPMNLARLAERDNDFNRRAADAGFRNPQEIGNKDKDKNKDKEKEKEKEKENTPEKQEAKMKEMFSKVKLPSGMEIRQEGPQWVLVSKDGNQRTDVTDVMNTIDKFNRNVDAVNEQNRMENAAQSGVDKAADINKKDNGLQVSETSGRVQMVGEALPMVKDINGEQLFKPEDIRAVAETAINFSNEKALLEKLKDPKELEELRKRNDRNEQAAERFRQLQRDDALRGGR